MKGTFQQLQLALTPLGESKGGGSFQLKYNCPNCALFIVLYYLKVMQEDLLRQAIELYQGGLSGSDIEKKLSIKNFYYYFKKQGGVIRPLSSSRKPQTEETKRKQSVSKLGSLNPNYKKLPNKKQIESLKKGRGNKSDKVKQQMSIKRKESWALGKYSKRKNLGGKSKIYYVDGRMCKGKNEKKFLELNKNTLPELLQVPKYINTPHGNYTPDFELKDYYIELKSEWTYKVFLGMCNFLGEETSEIKQLLKLKWVDENIKPVKVLIGYKNNFLQEKEFIYERNDAAIIACATALGRV